MRIRFIVPNFVPQIIFFPWDSLSCVLPSCWLKRVCPHGHIKNLEALNTKNTIAGVVVHGFYVIIKSTKERERGCLYSSADDHFSALHSQVHICYIKITFI